MTTTYWGEAWRLATARDGRAGGDRQVGHAHAWAARSLASSRVGGGSGRGVGAAGRVMTARMVVLAAGPAGAGELR